MGKKAKIRKSNVVFLTGFLGLGIYFLIFNFSLDTFREGRFVGVLIGSATLIIYLFSIVAIKAYKKTRRLNSIFEALKDIFLIILTAPIFQFKKKRKSKHI